MLGPLPAVFSYVPSPLYHAGHLYVIADGGVASCFEAGTGKEVWSHRLPGNFSSSPILVGERLYVTSESGRTYVLNTGRKFDVVARNDLNDRVLATPAVSGGQIFLRTDRHLYCLGSSTAAKGS